jgi:hypothetical protein
MSQHTPNTRDKALSRLKSANHWLIGVSVALTGVLTAVAANAFPGRTVKTSGAAAAAGTRKAGKSAGSESSASRLQAPTRTPQSSEEQGTESGAGEAESATQPPNEGSTEKPTEAEKPVEAEKAVEAEKPVEAEQKVETQPEAPVVSGGS